MNKIIEEDIQFILKSNIDWEKFKDKTILITGAGGMLLPYMVYAFLKKNESDPKFNASVIALVDKKEKAQKRFSHFLENRHLEFFEHDLSSPIKIDKSINYIIHGASLASPNYFAENPKAVVTPNILGTYFLLELAKERKVESFLFLSSGAVYGKPIKGQKITEQDYGYLDPLEVTNCYAESKRAGENMCKCWQAQFKIPVKIVRPAHMYGPTMDIKNDSRVVANFVNNIVSGQDIFLKSDGSGRRSFCYTADATVAFFKVLLNGENGQAYNIGNDDAFIPIKKLAEIFVSTFPEKNLKVFSGKSNSREEKMLMVSEKARQLGWECRFTIKEGIKRTVESFLNNN